MAPRWPVSRLPKRAPSRRSTPSSSRSRSASTWCRSAARCRACCAGRTSCRRMRASGSACATARRARTAPSPTKRSNVWRRATVHRACSTTWSSTTTSRLRNSTGCSRPGPRATPRRPCRRSRQMATFEPVLTRGIGEIDLTDIEVYKQTGGFASLDKALRQMTPEAVAGEVSASNLRGRGGAGFPTGKKWSFLPNDGRPRYLVCNCDEAEPGTFKDHMLLEATPFSIIEGMLIGAYGIASHHAFIYIRGEFKRGYEIFCAALDEARQAGYVGKDVFGSGYDIEITVHRGAGAYICGEETGLLNSLEGKRGEPRLKPPFPANAGLYGMPTVVNN